MNICMHCDVFVRESVCVDMWSVIHRSNSCFVNARAVISKTRHKKEKVPQSPLLDITSRDALNTTPIRLACLFVVSLSY
jgi:hypothetical protein